MIIFGFSNVCICLHSKQAHVYKDGQKGKRIDPRGKTGCGGFIPARQNITNIAEILNIPRTTISYVMKKFQEWGMVENIKRVERPCLIRGRDYWKLERLVKNDRRAPLGKITAKFNKYRVRRVCTKTVKRKFKFHNFWRGVYRVRVVVKKVNQKNRVSWCIGKRWRTVNNFWNNVIFSDESRGFIYVWRKPEEGWRPDLVRRCEQRPVKVMLWGCICYSGVRTLSKVDGNINAQKYTTILEDNIWPVIAHHFPNNIFLFQDDNAPGTQGCFDQAVLCNE